MAFLRIMQMRIIEVCAAEYEKMVKTVPCVFDTVAFSELNRHKAEAVSYLVFVDAKVRAGLIIGEKETGWYSPFSAPFGGFAACGELRLDAMDAIVSSLAQFGRGANAVRKPVHITMPPLVYGCSQLSKWANVLYRYGRLVSVDLNYHFELQAFQCYQNVIWRNARKNLRRFGQEDFSLLKLDSSSDDDIERAYSVIKANRDEHGYPLRMTLQDVKDTVKIIDADFFVMVHGGVDVAAAQVFRVADGIGQVVYWGDLRAYSHLRTMNGLARSLFAYYYGQGLKILDIGPSTVDSVPNYGLCEFKESIGCSVSPKYTFVI